jgi:hypothetical protein
MIHAESQAGHISPSQATNSHKSNQHTPLHGNTNIAVSSSFKFVNTSSPETFHSPDSDVNIDDRRKLPCTLVADSFRNFTVRFISRDHVGRTQTVNNPQRRTSVLSTPRLVSQLNGVTLSVATKIIESLCHYPHPLAAYLV